MMMEETTNNNAYLTLEQLSTILSEEGYICLGHGTGRSGDSDSVVDSIFEKGLRAKDNTLYYTSIGLSTPTPELIKKHEELGINPPSINTLETQLNNWKHKNSKKIILIRVPTQFINYEGDRSDLDGEMYGAFMDEVIDENNIKTYYLNSAFIIGCYDVQKKAVRLNKKFEKNLSEQTLEKIKKGYKKTLEKTQRRLKRLEKRFLIEETVNVLSEQSNVQEQTITDFGDDIVWDFPSLEDESSRKLR